MHVTHGWVRRPGLWLGFAFGGFFDGILLHQVLQWHHLLSGVSGGWFGELRHQVLADGLFHAAMFVVAFVGLSGLVEWRAGASSRPLAGQLTAADWLMGFAAWHLVDAVLSHGVLGLHRIRMDTTVPWAWDLGWALLFGVVPLLAARRLTRRGNASTVAGPLASLALMATLGGGAASLVPANGPTVVVLGDDIRGDGVFRAMADLPDARVVGSDASGTVWLVVLGTPMDAWQFYRQGAVYVSGTLGPRGCGAWFRAGPVGGPA